MLIFPLCGVAACATLGSACGQVANTPSVAISPTSGAFGTPVTITISDPPPGWVFDAKTMATWEGRYVPIVGSPTPVFRAAANAGQFHETTPTRGRIVIGEGSLTDAPSLRVLDIPGVLRGSLTVHLSNGHTVTSSCDFAPESRPCVWERMLYPDGFGGSVPPRIGGEPPKLDLYLLSVLPSGANPSRDQLHYAVHFHYAAVLRLPETPEAASSAPAFVPVDLVSFDADGGEIDRVRAVVLYRVRDDGDPAHIVYHNDLLRPIVLVDTALNKANYPTVVLLRGAPKGSVTIVLSVEPGVPSPEALARFSAPPVVRPEPPADPLEAAFWAIEWDRTTGIQGVVAEPLRALDTLVRPGDPAAWARLRALVNDPGASMFVRHQVLTLALAKADDRVADDLVEDALRWCEAGRAANTREGPEPPDADQSWSLLPPLIERLGAPPWSEWAADSPHTLALLREAGLGSARVLGSEQAAVSALAASPAPLEDRRKVAEAIILEGHPLRAHPDPRLIPLLDETSLPRLRAVMRQETDPHTFHWCAASALARLGDREIVPDLRARVEPFGVASAKFARALELNLWMIEAQHPPENLLPAIAAAADPAQPADRVWAIRSAVERGLPKEKIREAILAHARSVPVGEVRNRGTGKVHRFWLGLPELKATGLELGVLQPGDLPGVEVPAHTEGHADRRRHP